MKTKKKRAGPRMLSTMPMGPVRGYADGGAIDANRAAAEAQAQMANRVAAGLSPSDAAQKMKEVADLQSQAGAGVVGSVGGFDPAQVDALNRMQEATSRLNALKAAQEQMGAGGLDMGYAPAQIDMVNKIRGIQGGFNPAMEADYANKVRAMQEARRQQAWNSQFSRPVNGVVGGMPQPLPPSAPPMMGGAPSMTNLGAAPVGGGVGTATPGVLSPAGNRFSVLPMRPGGARPMGVGPQPGVSPSWLMNR